MGFRKRNAKRSDNRSSAKVIMGKPASQLSKEEKKILSARMAEIRSENGGKNTVQNTIPFLCMYQDGVCQVSENFFSLTVQFFDANYCEILRRMGARDERVKAALIGNITSGDFVEINKNDYQDIIYILLENIDFYDNNGRLIYE